METLAALRWIGWRGALALALLAALTVQSLRLATSETTVATMKARASRAEAAAARDWIAALEAARAKEAERAASVNRIAAAYERGKKDALDEERAVVAGLRAGNLRLRKLWQGCQANPAPGVPGAPADPGEPDAAAGLLQASVGRVLRIVRTCQVERDALLKIAEDDRKP